ncbi:MAG: GNAT family N-acetyltransferase [Clostridia bacterium]|nr:GNAT family N-acetyltransferase [Clostridia bacterium]
MIKTERLCIRRVRLDDWKAIQAIWADEAASAYARYDKPNDTNERAVLQRIARWASFADSDEHMFFAACLRDAMIGYIALNRREDGFELGYCFHSDHHGKGYAKESIAAVLRELKKPGPLRITAGTALDNTPSVRLLLSLGFIQTGTEKLSFYKDPEGNDIVFDGGIFELQLRADRDPPENC